MTVACNIKTCVSPLKNWSCTKKKANNGFWALRPWTSTTKVKDKFGVNTPLNIWQVITDVSDKILMKNKKDKKQYPSLQWRYKHPCRQISSKKKWSTMSKKLSTPFLIIHKYNIQRRMTNDTVKQLIEKNDIWGLNGAEKLTLLGQSVRQKIIRKITMFHHPIEEI